MSREQLGYTVGVGGVAGLSLTSWSHPCSCVPGRTMASAAAEAEKGSPVVVGLLVVGNVIILVRHLPVLGAHSVDGEKGVTWAWGWLLRAQDSPDGQCCRLSSQSSLDSNPSAASPSGVTWSK